ncbi:transglycosylase SLT domain-containing protein [Acidisphaera sp. L21]|uniref:transglycosylase SLT domain-containing protein n=1 Tax=Acidisphaera sp. L21 TaxID=1641851 RepID=UPI00131D6836|nr:transglycosylase SLT domain-containing protein [Acidisphaera sp. L21]
MALTGCEAAAADAEREKGLPPGLLTAIAGVESGMHATALRIGGQPTYPASTAQARIAARQALRRSQSVMAGCMQVNLQAHDPGGKLWALEPEHAANWAADYLNDLHDRLGSWRSAIQVYGGGGGQRYVRRVERHLDAALPNEVAEAP